MPESQSPAARHFASVDLRQRRDRPARL